MKKKTRLTLASGRSKAIILCLLLIGSSLHSYSQSCGCPALNSCSACVGGLSKLTLQYTGGGIILSVSASDNGGALGTSLLSSTITINSRVSGQPFDGNVTVTVTKVLGTDSETITTSCSQPAYQGSIFGNFTVVSGESLGGPICCSPPVISGCPSNITVSAGSNCKANVSWTAPTASDNCGIDTFTSSHNPGDLFNFGTTNVVYTATDLEGNVVTCSFNVNVVDNTNPVIPVIADITVSTSSSTCNAVVSWTAPVATDNCGIASLTPSIASGSTFNKGTTAVMYTATDVNGNTSTRSFNVIVNDATAPVIAGCPSNITLSANASCQATATWTAPTVTDNCPGVTMTSSHTSGSTFPKGTTLVTYTATDASGNISTCTFNVIVNDVTAPVIAGCPSNITLSANASCQATATWTAPTVTDNCPGVTMTSSHTSGSTFPKGTTLVTYTATDASGNTATCTFNVIVNDVTPPVITGCPANVIVSGACPNPASWTPPTATDNCPGVTMTSTHNPGDQFSFGQTTVTYTATDASGNTKTCTFKVIVADNTAPVITGCPSNITLSANASCQATATWTAPTATDNCSVNLTSTHNPGATFPVGVTTVTYTATDVGSNVSTCSFTVTVNDVTAPVIPVIPNINVSSSNATCNAVVSWTAPVATDNCGIASLTPNVASGSTFNVGTTVVTYTATDLYGNTATRSFNVTVADNTSPVIPVMPDITVSSSSVTCNAVVSWTAPAATDNCGIASLIPNITSGSTFNVGTTVVTYTATDVNGNISTRSFNVNVTDNTNPVIPVMSNITVSSSSATCNAVVSWTAPVATDNCGIASLTPDIASGSTFNVGTTVVTYTATDVNGNTSTRSFNVTVVDNTNPVIPVIANITVSSSSSTCNAIVSWTAPTATDNCGISTLIPNVASGSTFNVGTTVVTYTATDGNGNTSTRSFNVTVIDNTNPVIPVMSNITVSTGSSTCNAVVSWTAPVATDNCGIASLVSNITSGSTFNKGTTPVTYTATDVNGNISTRTFNVIVNDVTAPVIAGCPSNIILSANASCQATATWTAPTVTDNCSGVTMTSSHAPGSIFPKGITTVTYTATDASGNIATCSFTVTVNDMTVPVITGCPSNITLSANASCQAIATWTVPNATDNCSGVMMTSSHTSGSTFPHGTTVVTYTATDGSGNTATCTFNVIVNDVTAPVIAGCPSNITLSANALCQATATWTAPTATDNCPGLTLTSSHSSGSVFPLGVTTVTYTATDASSNTSTCSFTVTVNDTTVPIITGCPSNITLPPSASCQAIATWTAPTATDNCPGSVTLTSSHSSGSTFNAGTTVVTYTATDAHGNISTCTFNVNVADNIDPVIPVIANITVSSSSSTCNAVVSWPAPVATDDCGIASLTSDFASGTSFNVGTTIVTYTATDFNGNIATRSFNVNVTDDTDPIIPVIPNITIQASSSMCNAVVSWTAPVATDNCGIATLIPDVPSGSTFNVGTTTVTYTATDVNGNTSTRAFNVTVNDETAPAITGCPSNITAAANAASCQANVTWTPPVATDNCSGVILSSSHQPGDPFPIGTTEVTYTATDGGGRKSICKFNVIVTDESAPVVTGYPTNDIVVAAAESCGSKISWPVLTIRDCGTVTITSSHTKDNVFAIGTTEVTITCTDEHGNSSSDKFNVVVQDKTSPVFSNCPAEVKAVANASCVANVNWTEPIASDPCGIASVTSTYKPGDTFPIGQTEVTYTATDIYGNVSSCKFNVVVKNEHLPIITGCPQDIIAKTNESGEVSVDWTPPTATTACNDEVSLSSSFKPGDFFTIGTTEVEYLATDNLGNSTSCKFKVIVSYEELQFNITKVITPDGDGINDEWILPNIEKFRNNSVIIVDRWGSVIYRASGYNNESVVWTGVNANGVIVPTGTYFYTISVRFGQQTLEKKGFIELIR